MKKGISKLLVAGLIASMLIPAGNDFAEAARKMKLNKKSITLKVGKSAVLKVKNKEKKVKVTWKSKNKKIASVSKKGKVTGRKKGTTKIVCIAKKGKRMTKLTCRVKVTKKVSTPKPKLTAVPAVTDTSVQKTTSPAIPVQTQETTPSPKPEVSVTYHPDWPSRYEDEYIPLKNLSSTFRIGTAIAGSAKESAAIYDPDMRGILQKHYNSTTFTNLMKPLFLLDFAASINSEDGMPAVNFDACKECLDFCRDTGIKLRGHVLVWYNQTPDWFFYEDYDTSKNLVDKATMSKRMESYIKQVVTYVQTNYPGVVYCWDVVNEAVGDNGEIRGAGNKWFEVYAEGNKDYKEYEYVKDAFSYARKYVEPGVALVYNDYNTFVPLKRKEILNLIQYVNKEEKLIDAIGMQSPLLPNWPAIKAAEDTEREKDPCVEYAIEDFAQTGLEIMITELCVRTNGKNAQSDIENQAARYKEMYQLLLDMDSENGGPANISSVTTFGIADSYRLYSQAYWDNNGDPSRYAWLFDRNCEPKLGFKCVYNVFAKAAGKETVPETYEEPDESVSDALHVVSGRVRSKNGVDQKNFRIVFSNLNTEEYTAVFTDENGFYSIELPAGSYGIYSRIGEERFVITKKDDAVMEKNFTLSENYYTVNGKVRSASGKVMSNAFFELEVRDSDGNEIDYQAVTTDEEGAFQVCVCEGTTYFYEDMDYNGKFCFEVNRDYSVENPIEITVSYDVSHVTGKLDTGMHEFAGEGSLVEVIFKNSLTRKQIEVKEGAFESDIRSGEYSVYVQISNEDEDNCIYIYYSDVDLSKDASVSISKNNIHEIEIVPDNEVGLTSVVIDDFLYDLNSKIYIGNVSATMKGNCTDYDDEGNVTGFYRYNTPFEVTSSDGAKKSVPLHMETFAVQELKPDEMTTGTIADFSDENKTYQGRWMYSFTPEEDGEYTIYSQSGIEPQNGSETGVQIKNSKLEYMASAYSYPSMDFSCTAKLTAGETYYISVSFYAEAQLEDAPFPIGIKKS